MYAIFIICCSNYLLLITILLKVSLLGTPAEEQRGGKLTFIKAQIFKDVDFAMTAHPSQYSISRPNYVAVSEWVHEHWCQIKIGVDGKVV